MNTNIFVPKKINVGFQNRDDTYTGKLAYIVYFDEKGKLRKQSSWDNWRNQDIPNEIFDNEPTEGFVINKNAGGVEASWSHNVRKTYVRVYDPRGFEFEITIPNLLWILENCNSIKGKGLEGQFVYGWDGKELVLVPIESPDYREIQAKNEIIHSNDFIKSKDLIPGAAYETVKGEKFVFLGKHFCFEYEVNFKRYPSQEWTYPLDETWKKDIVFRNDDVRIRAKNRGKWFWFMRLGDPNASWWERENKLYYYKSVSRKFCRIISKRHKQYPEFYAEMERSDNFYPIDFDASRILPLSFEAFKAGFMEFTVNGSILRDFHFYSNYNGYLDERRISPTYYYDGRYDNKERHYYYYSGINKIFFDPFSDFELRKIYELFQPVYGEQFLTNGKLHKRRGYYDTEK